MHEVFLRVLDKKRQEIPPRLFIPLAVEHTICCPRSIFSPSICSFPRCTSTRAHRRRADRDIAAILDMTRDKRLLQAYPVGAGTGDLVRGSIIDPPKVDWNVRGNRQRCTVRTKSLFVQVDRDQFHQAVARPGPVDAHDSP